MNKADQAVLRLEFWNLPDDAWASREMVAATFYQSIANFEAMAIHGGGPAYRRIGRRALYQKRDVLQWAATNGKRVENTAQLS